MNLSSCFQHRALSSDKKKQELASEIHKIFSQIKSMATSEDKKMLYSRPIVFIEDKPDHHKRQGSFFKFHTGNRRLLPPPSDEALLGITKTNSEGIKMIDPLKAAALLRAYSFDLESTLIVRNFNDFEPQLPTSSFYSQARETIMLYQQAIFVHFKYIITFETDSRRPKYLRLTSRTEITNLLATNATGGGLFQLVPPIRSPDHSPAPSTSSSPTPRLRTAGRSRSPLAVPRAQQLKGGSSATATTTLTNKQTNKQTGEKPKQKEPLKQAGEKSKYKETPKQVGEKLKPVEKPKSEGKLGQDKEIPDAKEEKNEEAKQDKNSKSEEKKTTKVEGPRQEDDLIKKVIELMVQQQDQFTQFREQLFDKMSSVEVKAVVNQERTERLSTIIDTKYSILEDDYKVIRRKLSKLRVTSKTLTTATATMMKIMTARENKSPMDHQVSDTEEEDLQLHVNKREHDEMLYEDLPPTDDTRSPSPAESIESPKSTNETQTQNIYEVRTSDEEEEDGDLAYKPKRPRY